MKFWQVLRRIGMAAVVVVVTTTCNSGVTNTGDTNLTDNGFTDASAGEGDPNAGTDNSTVVDNSSPQAEDTRSFFSAFQIDPKAEDTAGPKFVVAGDIDQDGLTDLVSAWNQSQPIQIHLQRRDPDGNISFRTITLAGTTPTAIMAGVEVGYINDDEWPDIVVLVKASGYATFCPHSPPTQISNLDGRIFVYFNPGEANDVADGDRWTQMELINPMIADIWIHNQYPGNESVDWDMLKTQPEHGGFTSLAVGNIDGIDGDEIVVSNNPGSCDALSEEPPVTTVDLWINPGGANAEDSTAWGVQDGGFSRGVPITLLQEIPEITDVQLEDIDNDSDLDIVVAVSNSISANIRWLRNPLVAHTVGGPDGPGEVISGSFIGNAACVGGQNDGSACTSDADCASCPVDQPDCANPPTGTCVSTDRWYVTDSWQERPIGQVDTGADVMAIGDLDNDGFNDVLIRSTNGQIIQWFRKPNTLTIEPEFPPSDPVPDRTNFPWPVFTLTEFDGQAPEAIAIGDVTNDGQNEVMVAVDGGVYWYDGTVNETVYDPWVANTIIQDTPADTTDPTTIGGTTPGAGVGVTQVDTSTFINALLIADLDGDGRNDIIGTLDRRSGSGLSDDRLVWYRNTRGDDSSN